MRVSLWMLFSPDHFRSFVSDKSLFGYEIGWYIREETPALFNSFALGIHSLLKSISKAMCMDPHFLGQPVLSQTLISQVSI